MVDVGDILAGKYRVERVLGRGGMGYVVSAFHTQLGQHVAVKFMMPELCGEQEPVTRFLREARAAVRIKNEHVARVLDVGTMDGGAPYMVMEYLEGHDLADELDRRVQLPTYEAVDYLLQASEAIAEAHALGIVHRDLKPANLFLTRRIDGSALIKVLDFGISKALVDESGMPANSLTATQALIGSPQYMSPEQVRTPKTVDGRSDIWALGVILYELLTGKQPFQADTSMSVLAAVVSDPTPPLRPFRPDVPEGIEAVVMKCLQKRVDDRYPGIADFAQALEPFAPPYSLPSIQRITGTFRPSIPGRVSANTPTSDGKPTTPPNLEISSANAIRAHTPLSLPDADTVQATPESLPKADTDSLAEIRQHTKTAAEWGGSTKPGAERSTTRRNLIWAAAGAASAIAITVVVSAMSGSPSTSPAASGSSTSAAAPSVAPDEAHTPELGASTTATGTTPSSETPVVEPVTAPTPSASASEPPPKHTARPVKKTPTPTPTPKTSASAKTAPPPNPTSGTPDPLEGRR